MCRLAIMDTARMSLRAPTLIALLVPFSFPSDAVAQSSEAIAKGVYEWLTPARLRGQPGAPRIVGTSAEGMKTLVHIAMPNNELLVFECRKLDRGGTICVVPGRADMTVELP